MLKLQQLTFNTLNRSIKQIKIYCYSTKCFHTAGLIIIGDEILKGQVKDENIHFMTKLLHDYGVSVKKVSVITDSENDIANEIKTFSKKYSFVFTSGGIGPTHDDNTYAGLAQAFDNELHYHPVLVDFIRNQFGIKDISSPAYKMAYVPTEATIVQIKIKKNDGKVPYPRIQMKNVFVFPGSPTYMNDSFKYICQRLFSQNNSFATEEVFLNAAEEVYADSLTVLSQHLPNVTFGSYPNNSVNSGDYKARVTIESTSQIITELAKILFYRSVPKSIIIDNKSKSSSSKFKNFLSELINLYKNPESIVLCLDDSAESVAIAYLAFVINGPNSSKKLQAIYMKNESSTDVPEFIRQLEKNKKLQLLSISTDNVEKMIKNLKATNTQLTTFIINSRVANEKNSDLSSQHGIRIPLLGQSEEDIEALLKSQSLFQYSLPDKKSNQPSNPQLDETKLEKPAPSNPQAS